MNVNKIFGELNKIKIKKQQVCYVKNSWDNVDFSYDIDTQDVYFESI